MVISSFARYTVVLVLSAGLWFSPTSVTAETVGGNPLRIEIVNIERAEGPLRLQILDSKAAFG
ncbi:MAG: hypothetical protein AAF736_20510, partial [Pseudomonadota bacterium]